MNLKGILKTLIARIFPVSVAQAKSFFRLWERKGFHITPVSYEEPIPDTATLKDDLWQRQSKLVGIDLNEQGQIDLLSLFSSRFREEYESFPRNKTLVPYQYYVNNGKFESEFVRLSTPGSSDVPLLEKHFLNSKQTITQD